jgi:hypothetical protein
MVVVAAQQGMWDQLDDAIRRLQNMNMRMRYSPKPVVVLLLDWRSAAVVKITMHASRVVAAAETYIGLVELGAGVIPAGAGTKEYMRRIINPAVKVPEPNLPVHSKGVPANWVRRKLPPLQKKRAAWESFRPARPHCDQSRSSADRSQERSPAHDRAGYRPPAPELIYALGATCSAR